MANDDSSPEMPLWRHPAFLRFLYVRIAASVALQIQVVAVGWQMYELTDSPFRLGLIGLVQFVPAICLFPLTGHVADRFDRRWVTFIGEIVEALAVGVLAVANFSGHLTPDLLLAMAFIVGTGRAFEQPSVQSVLPNIVSAKALPHAVAASTSGSQTAVVAGPALGGILVALSPTLVFAVAGLIWLSAGLVMITVAIERTSAARMPLDLKTLFSGVAFVARHKIVLGAILLDMLAVLFGNAMALLPVFARDIYAAGPLGFGILRAAPAVGSITTALMLARWPISDRVGRVMFATVTIFGIGTILLALAPSFIFALGAMVIIGASDTVSVVIRQTMVQLRTPDEMRGRVYAVNSMAVITSNQLGDFRAGAAAAAFGTIPSVLIGGFSILAVVLISRKVFGELYKADRYHVANS
ncbi:MAG TPA: MFS transporter [Xanthobacteraceae bacterium]|jgi:MFS family permease|nr:MFS transporter [Xanthobacteraceae bacterium]